MTNRAEIRSALRPDVREFSERHARASGNLDADVLRRRFADHLLMLDSSSTRTLTPSAPYLEQDCPS